MPARFDVRVVLFSVFLTLTVSAMLTATFWALGQLVRGRRLLPPWPEPPRRVPWGVYAFSAAVATWVLSMALVPLVYGAIHPAARVARPGPPGGSGLKGPDVPRRAHGADLGPRDFREQMLLISAINLLIVVSVPSVLRATSGARPEDLGLAFGSWRRDLKIGAVSFLAATPAVMAVNILAVVVWKPTQHPLESMLRKGASPFVIGLAYVSAVLLAPAAEELFFRGVIQASLRRFLRCPLPSPGAPASPGVGEVGRPREGGRAWVRWLPRLPGRRLSSTPAPPDPFGPPPAPGESSEGPTAGRPASAVSRMLPVVLTSALFAAIHFQQMPAPLAIFPLALLLGCLYETTGTLLPSFVLHALFNGFNTTLLVGALLTRPGGV